MKMVINKCYGGFGVSDTLIEYWREQHPEEDTGNLFPYMFHEKRIDPDFVSLVQHLGKDANGHASNLVIVDIPDDATDWMIDEYDGFERIIYVQNGKLGFA